MGWGGGAHTEGERRRGIKVGRRNERGVVHIATALFDTTLYKIAYSRFGASGFVTATDDYSQQRQHRTACTRFQYLTAIIARRR